MNRPLIGLRALRSRRGLTQEQVGALVGFTKAYICELETGRKGARTETLFALAAQLNVSIDSLFTLPDDATPRLASTARPGS